MKKFILITMIAAMAITGVACGEKKEEAKETQPVVAEETSEKIEENVAEEVETEKEFEYLLYLKSKEYKEITGERFVVQVPSDTEAMKLYDYVIKHLLSFGDELDYVVNPIPENTELKNMEIEDSKLTLTFSKELSKNAKSEDDFKMAIGAIVNTMVAIDGVDSVKIKIEGEESTVKGVDLDEFKIFDTTFFPDK